MTGTPHSRRKPASSPNGLETPLLSHGIDIRLDLLVGQPVCTAGSRACLQAPDHSSEPRRAVRTKCLALIQPDTDHHRDRRTTPRKAHRLAGRDAAPDVAPSPAHFADCKVAHHAPRPPLFDAPS